jgi:hypothetical protein
MLGQEMFPYLRCPGPLNLTDEALGWGDRMLVSHMPFNFLGSSVCFIATIVMAWPLLGAHYPVLGILRNFYFEVPWSFERVNAWKVFQLLR